MLLAELGDPPLDLLLFKEQNEEKYFGIFFVHSVPSECLLLILQ